MSVKKNYILYAGTYSSEKEPGISGYICDETQKCVCVCQGTGIENPSFLTVSSDHVYLYAVSETMTYDGQQGGSIAAFQMKDGSLKLLNQTGTTGTLPCHVLLDERRKYLYVSNYMSGSLSMFQLLQDGSIGAMCDFHQHEGVGINPDRQEGPHVHFAGFSEDYNGIWCVDLGIDTVRYYEINEKEAKLISKPQWDIHLPGGVGPRHFVLHPQRRDIMYLVCELSSEVFVVDCSRQKNIILQRIPTLVPGTEGSSCAAIKISEDGAYLYASNRGDDSIAVYAADSQTKLLTLVEITKTNGCTPRDIWLKDELLFAANQESQTITIFHRDANTGMLRLSDQYIACNTPVCLVSADI